MLEALIMLALMAQSETTVRRIQVRGRDIDRRRRPGHGELGEAELEAIRPTHPSEVLARCPAAGSRAARAGAS
jgi:iron complex outermembrane recepter protein